MSEVPDGVVMITAEALAQLVAQVPGVTIIDWGKPVAEEYWRENWYSPTLQRTGELPMSFSMQFEAKHDEDLAGAFDDAVVERSNTDKNLAKADEQGWLEEAKQAVLMLVDKVAREGDGVTVSVYGHINSSKDENPGWSSNQITITITQRYAKPVIETSAGDVPVNVT